MLGLPLPIGYALGFCLTAAIGVRFAFWKKGRNNL